MPLWLNHQGVSDSGIGFWMAVMVSAGILGQWPVGRLQTATVACCAAGTGLCGHSGMSGDA